MPSPAVTSRLDKLNIAASLSRFDQDLNRSAWGSLAWGAFSALVGLIFLYSRVGWINLGFGLLLIAEGIYEKQVREPRVIKVSAATLGILGLWNVVPFVLALYLKSSPVGHPFIGIAQLLGAWSTYASYSTYARLLATCDPHSKLEFEALLAETKRAVPATSPDIAEFLVSKFGSEDVSWRVRRFDDLLFFLGNETVFGRKRSPSTCLFVSRNHVSFEITGEKMFGSRKKAVITVQGTPWKAEITPEMAGKLQMLLS